MHGAHVHSGGGVRDVLVRSGEARGGDVREADVWGGTRGGDVRLQRILRIIGFSKGYFDPAKKRLVRTSESETICSRWESSNTEPTHGRPVSGEDLR